jgi:hypothetical protein
LREDCAVRFALVETRPTADSRGDSPIELVLTNGERLRMGPGTAVRQRRFYAAFVASGKRCGVEPFTSFRDVLSRIPSHPITRLR